MIETDNTSFSLDLIAVVNWFRARDLDSTIYISEGCLIIKSKTINPSKISAKDLGGLLKRRWGFYNGVWKYKAPSLTSNLKIIEGLNIFQYMIGTCDPYFVDAQQGVIYIHYNNALTPEALPIEIKFMLEQMGWEYPIDEDRWRFWI